AKYVWLSCQTWMPSVPVAVRKVGINGETATAAGAASEAGGPLKSCRESASAAFNCLAATAVAKTRFGATGTAGAAPVSTENTGSFWPREELTRGVATGGAASRRMLVPFTINYPPRNVWHSRDRNSQRLSNPPRLSF